MLSQSHAQTPLRRGAACDDQMVHWCVVLHRAGCRHLGALAYLSRLCQVLAAVFSPCDRRQSGGMPSVCAPSIARYGMGARGVMELSDRSRCREAATPFARIAWRVLRMLGSAWLLGSWRGTPFLSDVRQARVTQAPVPVARSARRSRALILASCAGFSNVRQVRLATSAGDLFTLSSLSSFAQVEASLAL